MRMSQAAAALQQFLDVMCILCYGADDKRPLGKRKNEKRLGRALKKANVSFIPEFKYLSAFVIIKVTSFIQR